MADKKSQVAIHIVAFDNATKALKQVNDRLDRLKKPFRETFNAASALNKQSGMGNALSNIGHGALAAARNVAMLGTAAGVAVAGVVALVNSASNTGDAFAKQAKRTGFGVEALQEWQHAAGLSGATVEEFGTSLEKFTKNMGDARAGGGPLLSLLKDVNPAFMKQLLAVKDNEQAFSMMMKAIQSLKDPQRQATLATAAFGKQGQKLIVLANEGADAIAKMRAEARELGIISKEDAEKAERFNDSWGRFTRVIESVKNSLAFAFMPVLNDVIDDLTTFLKENREDIRKWAETFATTLPDRIDQAKIALNSFATETWPKIRDEVEKFMNRLGPCLDLIAALVDKFGAANLATAAFAFVIGSQLIMGFVGLAVAISKCGAALTPLVVKFAALALANLPLVATIGIIASVGLAIYGLYKNWDEVSAKFKESWTKFKDGFAEIWNGIVNGFSQAFATVGKLTDKFMASTGIGKVIGLVRSLFSSDDSGKTAQASPSGAPLLAPAGAPLGGQSLLQGVRESRVTRDAAVSVSFANMPPGTRVEKDRSSTAPLDLTTGIAMVTP